jgi:hypothetical protein
MGAHGGSIRMGLQRMLRHSANWNGNGSTRRIDPNQAARCWMDGDDWVTGGECCGSEHADRHQTSAARDHAISRCHRNTTRLQHQAWTRLRLQPTPWSNSPEELQSVLDRRALVSWRAVCEWLTSSTPCPPMRDLYRADAPMSLVASSIVFGALMALIGLFGWMKLPLTTNGEFVGDDTAWKMPTIDALTLCSTRVGSSSTPALRMHTVIALVDEASTDGSSAVSTAAVGSAV